MPETDRTASSGALPKQGVWARRLTSYAKLGLRNLPVALANRVLLKSVPPISPERAPVRAVYAKNLPGPIFVRLGTSDLWVFTEIFVDGEYDALRALNLSNVQTVVDLGSNIGLSLRYWRGLYPQARLVGVEPDPANMLVCKRNVSKMDGPTPVLVQAAVAGVCRQVALDRSGLAWGFRIQNPAPDVADIQGHERIDALTMPELLSRAGVLGEIDVLKCDIEGAESEVFADCVEWIGRVRTLIIETHAPYSAEKLIDDLARNGFAGHTTSLKRDHNVHVVMITRADQVQPAPRADHG